MSKTNNKPAKQKVSETARIKVGVDGRTKELMNQLKAETGIPHARMVKDAIAEYAEKTRRRFAVAS